MKKVVTIVGARPQFIKAAVLSRAIREDTDIEESIVHTGQHFDDNMSAVFFRELRMPVPSVNLNIHASRHGAMTGRMLEAIESLLIDNRPDLVLVFGDTNSTLAGALAAAKLRIAIAHVEAGMRAYQRIAEEINRVATDHIADILFSVGPRSTENLRQEGIAGARVIEVGDVMYDCALASAEIARRQSKILEALQLVPRGFALCTAHRAENTDHADRLTVLFAALAEMATRMTVVLPIHPRTRGRAEEFGLLGGLDPRVLLIDPVGYLDMVRLEQAAAVVLTDSGGVQREAYFHGTPCVTIRDETEWPELIESGWNVLAPLCDAKRLADLASSRIGTTGRPVDAFGAGDAARKIAHYIAQYLSCAAVSP